MKENPLISVNLPTFNGADTVRRALESVKNQTYKNYEIVVVDHNSVDKTIEIVKEYTDKIYFDEKRILHSRKIGLEKSKGEILLFLSCDQILAPDLLERTVKKFVEEDVDMIVNEERAYKPETFIEKLTDIDRKVVHSKRELDPTKSVLLPSTFKKELLIKIFKKFKGEWFERVTIHEHAIIYFEARKISNKVGYIPKGVYHEEPKSVRELFNHYFSWGKRGKAIKNIIPKEYNVMFESKLMNRLKSIRLSGDEIRTLPITFLKGAGFKLGYYLSKA